MTVERVVTAGRTREYSRYHVNHIPKGKRSKRTKESPDRIKKSNLRKRTDRLRQLMNANFNDKEFWSMTLTYRKGEEPDSIRQVRNDAQDFVKRLRKCARLFGVELKFIYVIGAGMHRRHIHITVNALPDMAIFTGCWIHGHVNMTQLYSDGQYKDLADYYIKNAQDTREQEIKLGENPGQMYVTSKNLIQPTEEKRVVFGKFKAEPETMPGYYLDKDSVYYGITSMGFPLLRYTLIQERKDERDKAIHLHGRSGAGLGQSEDVLPDAVRKGRTGDRVENGLRSGRQKPEGRNTRSNNISSHKDKRRKRDTTDHSMPLPRRDTGDKSKAVRKVVREWMEKLKRRGSGVRR